MNEQQGTTPQTNAPLKAIALFPVESKRLSAAGYDPETQTLAIQFKDNSRTYRYQHVPLGIWDGFEKAESKGTYFYGSIYKKFGFLRVEADGDVSKVERFPDTQPSDSEPMAA